MIRTSRHRVRAVVSALALLSGFSAAPAHAANVAGIRIDNFGRVDEHYYRGAQPKGDDFRALSALGVRMVIDLAAEGDPGEAANAKAAGMQFVRIPMTTHDVPTAAVISQFLSLVDDPANQPVYVHCIGGRHRTGVMTAIYRMTVDGWNADRAFGEMQQFKFGAVFLHPEFKDFVDHYAVPATSVAVPQVK